MLYRDYEANEWKLMPLVAKYHQRGEDHEQHVIDESELRAHEEMGHITELVFEDAEYDAETLSRLDEVEGYPESEFATVEAYVLHNEVLEGTSLAIKKQLEILEQSTLELAMVQGGLF